jgi:hypothetical protein
VEAIGLFWGDDESGLSEVVEDLGDSSDSFARFELDEDEVILWSLWLFIKSVSILLHARVNMARGSHFSSYCNKDARLLFFGSLFRKVLDGSIEKS